MEPKLQAALNRERIIKLLAVLSVIATGITVLLAVNNLLVSFVFAFVISYLLDPIVGFFERKGVPREASILIPFILCGILIGIGVYKILPLLTAQVNLLEAQLPKYQIDLMNLVSSTEGRFRGFLKTYNISFSQSINSWILSKTAEISTFLPSLISGSLSVLLLSPFFAFFMLLDGRRMVRSILGLVPNNLFELSLNLQYQLNEQMGGFIRARFLEAAIVGFVVWIGLQGCGFPYATLLGVFAGAVNLIPYIGPIIGAIPAILIALISNDAMITDTMSINLILVSSIYFFAQLVDMIFIIPLVVAKIVNLHPATVVIVIIIGSQVMGILGMVISIPVASAIKLIFRTLYDHLSDFRT